MKAFHTEVARSLHKQFGKQIGLTLKQIKDLLEIPDDSGHGDLAFPCFPLAKKLKQAPKNIAKDLEKNLEPTPSTSKVESVGGYLNFFIDQNHLAKTTLTKIYEEKDAFGSTDLGKARPVIVEYSSPNIAKPFGIGHLRSTNIGHALANLYKFLNYEVISINHLGDWGTQFGKILSAYKRWGTADFLKGDPLANLHALYVRFHQEEKNNPELADEARLWFSKLESGDKEATELWQWFRDITLKELKDIYSRFGIQFDYNWGESFYTDKMEATVDRLREMNLLKESESAQVVLIKKKGIPPAIIKKSDDTTLYITRDLSAAEHRYETFKFHKMLYVVGVPQSLHFEQLFSVLRMMGYKWANRLTHVAFGHLSFKEGSGTKAMSTREGTIIFLKDVLAEAEKIALSIIKEKNPDLEDKEKVAEQVARGAIIYADFSSKRRKDVKFAWEEILNFDGETGPYLQYTAVRMKSLLTKFTGSVTDQVDFSLLTSSEAKETIKCLAIFPEVLVHSLKENEPFVLASYLTTLAKTFNRFYTKNRILDADGEVQLARVLLTHCTSTVMESGLGLLGIPVPDKM
jgi:arginyl-tRNA synthetase